ncbi:hypothetical protein H9P43_001735 [Blastocladiella emersonii ATCC 22665]|nr:hypothetical protein H9P43_001735 [Blastocladiella emersonii ATCC 22665]
MDGSDPAAAAAGTAPTSVASSSAAWDAVLASSTASAASDMHSGALAPLSFADFNDPDDHLSRLFDEMDHDMDFLGPIGIGSPPAGSSGIFTDTGDLFSSSAGSGSAGGVMSLGSDLPLQAPVQQQQASFPPATTTTFIPSAPASVVNTPLGSPVQSRVSTPGTAAWSTGAPPPPPASLPAFAAPPQPAPAPPTQPMLRYPATAGAANRMASLLHTSAYGPRPSSSGGSSQNGGGASGIQRTTISGLLALKRLADGTDAPGAPTVPFHASPTNSAASTPVLGPSSAGAGDTDSWMMDAPPPAGGDQPPNPHQTAAAATAMLRRAASVPGPIARGPLSRPAPPFSAGTPSAAWSRRSHSVWPLMVPAPAHYYTGTGAPPFGTAASLAPSVAALVSGLGARTPANPMDPVPAMASVLRSAGGGRTSDQPNAAPIPVPAPVAPPRPVKRGRGGGGRDAIKACVHCKASHVGCDANRPCERCVRNGKADTCVDATRKKRGRPETTKEVKQERSRAKRRAKRAEATEAARQKIQQQQQLLKIFPSAHPVADSAAAAAAAAASSSSAAVAGTTAAAPAVAPPSATLPVATSAPMAAPTFALPAAPLPVAPVAAAATATPIPAPTPVPVAPALPSPPPAASTVAVAHPEATAVPAPSAPAHVSSMLPLAAPALTPAPAAPVAAPEPPAPEPAPAPTAPAVVVAPEVVPAESVPTTAPGSPDLSFDFSSLPLMDPTSMDFEAYLHSLNMEIAELEGPFLPADAVNLSDDDGGSTPPPPAASAPPPPQLPRRGPPVIAEEVIEAPADDDDGDDAYEDIIDEPPVGMMDQDPALPLGADPLFAMFEAIANMSEFAPATDYLDDVVYPDGVEDE